MTTLTLKGKTPAQTEQPAQNPPKPKGPHYWHPFLEAESVIVDMQSGRTWTGKLLSVHNYELLLQECDHGLMMILKEGIEGVRLVQP